jgi:hypothetical protein
MGTTVPYITVAELKRSPIYTQLQKLVPGQSDADRDAELGAIIRRVSAMINGEVNQNLAASVDDEIGRLTVSNDGELRIHTRSNPIIEVQSISLGPDVYNLTPVTDLTHLVLDPWRITIPRGSNQLVSGNLPMTGVGRPGQRLWAQFTYVNGYPVTTLAAPTAVGDTSITVADATGIVAGTTLLTIKDGRLLEQVVPTAVNGNTLTVPALVNAHAAGVGVTALPDDIEEATLLLISRLHDTWSLSMGAITHDGTGAKVPGAKVARAMCDAAVMLSPYRRMW